MGKTTSVSTFFLISLFIVILLLLLFSPAYGSAIEIKQNNSEDNKSNHDFYLTKVCTAYDKSHERYGLCDKGYILKIETLVDGTIEESVFMDEYDGYAWSYTTIKRLKDDIYLFRLGCGNYCAGNILVGRYGQKQGFDYWFVYDRMRECALEYDDDKKLWVAKPFFSNSVYELPQTYGTSESAVMPRYNIEAVGNGMFIATDNFGDSIEYIYNPCNC